MYTATIALKIYDVTSVEGTSLYLSQMMWFEKKKKKKTAMKRQMEILMAMAIITEYDLGIKSV